MAPTGSVHLYLSSTSQERPGTAPTISLTSRLPSTSQERLATAALGSLPPRLPVDSQERPEMDSSGGLPPHLPDVCDAMRARVAPFLLTNEDSPSDEEASPFKRRRCTIKSGRLHTWDTHVIHRVKWPHEMVFFSQGQAPMYEDMPLVFLANVYLAVVVVEGTSVKENMLCHLGVAWLQLLEQG